MRGGQYVLVVAPSSASRSNPLPTLCFQNGGSLRTLNLEQASACQKTPVLQASQQYRQLRRLNNCFTCREKPFAKPSQEKISVTAGLVLVTNHNSLCIFEEVTRASFCVYFTQMRWKIRRKCVEESMRCFRV